MSGSHRRVIPREELSAFQRWQFNSLLDTPAAVAETVVSPSEIEASQAGAVAEAPILEEPLSSVNMASAESDLPLEPAMPYPTAEEIEAIQQQAHDEGFQAGLEAGRLAAEAEVLHLQSLIASVTDTLQAADTQLAESVLDLALLVARQMICDELKNQPKLLLAPIREALAVMPTATNPSRLFLSLDDAELLQSALHMELPADVWRIVPDPNMQSGSCKIETPATQLSYTLASRWEKIIKVLKRGQHPELAWGVYPDVDVDEPTSSKSLEEPKPASLKDSSTAENDAVD